jgi:DNA-binding MarR family transcriptional regulator
MTTPKQELPRAAVTRTLAALEVLQQRLIALHAVEFTALDITMAQAKLLYVLTAAGELSMSETAQRLGVSVSTASGAVDHLVGLRLLARSEHPGNRRQVRVSVTEEGLQILEQVRELNTRQLVKLFEFVTDDDLEIVERATRILADAAFAAGPVNGPTGAAEAAAVPGARRS